MWNTTISVYSIKILPHKFDGATDTNTQQSFFPFDFIFFCNRVFFFFPLAMLEIYPCCVRFRTSLIHPPQHIGNLLVWIIFDLFFFFFFRLRLQCYVHSVKMRIFPNIKRFRIISRISIRAIIINCYFPFPCRFPTRRT